MTQTTRRAARLAVVLSLVSLSGACQSDPPNFGRYPEQDDTSQMPRVSKAEAIHVAEFAVEGLAKGDFELWSTQWSDEMRKAIDASAFEGYRNALLADYGPVLSLAEARITDATADGHVRYSFLIECEGGQLMMIHVYPVEGDEIVGVHLRDADTGEVPEALQ